VASPLPRFLFQDWIQEASTMGRKTHRVEVFIDGSLVYATREPAAPFDDEPVNSAQDAVRHFTSIREMAQEVFAVMSLNGANKPIRVRWTTVGLLDSNQVHPREVFADPLTDRAAAIIVAHNHPSGTLQPSAEDVALTQRLQRAGELLGIRILDHLIVTRDGFISLKQAGHL
jgi:DNA repair protein RadC